MTFFPFFSDDLKSILFNLLPYRLTNRNTIYNQTKVIKPSICLDVVIYQLRTASNCQLSKFGGFLTIFCDSDNFYCVLYKPEMESQRKTELLKVLKSGHYIKFKNLGIVSKTGVRQLVKLQKVISY